MIEDIWPLFALRITTPRVELRYVDDHIAADLADLSAGPIHDPQLMPFAVAWTDVEPEHRRVGALKHVWNARATLTKDAWSLHFAVYEDGVLCGMQEMSADRFPILRSVATGSWLSRRHQGRGIGREMRAAVLHLAFAGLDAVDATTMAHEDNVASQRVTNALGYEPDGMTWHAPRGHAVRSLRFRLPRERWETNRRDDIVLHGLDACLPVLGVFR